VQRLRLPGLPSSLALALADAADTPVLSVEEQARAETFGHADRRLAFALGRTAARNLLGESLGIDGRVVPLSVGADGAPETAGRCVSIAHTGRGASVIATAAVSPGPIGVDLERVGPRRADLWRRVLTPAEYDLLDALGGPTDEAQTLLWALKESVLKGQRTGFRAGAQSIRLSPGGRTEATGGLISAVSDQSGRWEIAYASLGGAWVAVAWAAERADN